MRKKPDAEDHVCCDPVCVTCPEQTSVEVESRSVFSRGWGWGVTANGDAVSFRGEENVEFDSYPVHMTL